MLFLGDLSCPDDVSARQLTEAMEASGIFSQKLVLCNLEGMICEREPYQDKKLFNHPEVLSAFEKDKTIFSLANNHTYDYPELIEPTEKLLRKKGFYYNGIFRGEEIKPVEVPCGNEVISVFTHCWNVYTRTNPNQTNDLQVVDCPYDIFYNTVSNYIKSHPKFKVICYFHWNYDLENLPFPAHRKIAKDLIDTGVYAIIGNHSHVPQGGEIYKGRPIVYGLGNFYMPSNYFFGGELIYSEESKKMMVFELDVETGTFTCHWFWTDKEEKIEYICSEDFEKGEIISSYSPYRDLDEKKYLRYFKKNRVKRFLVPVFDQYKGISSVLKENIAVVRIKVIKKIKK